MTQLSFIAQFVHSEVMASASSWLPLAPPAFRLVLAAALAFIGLWLFLPTGAADWRRVGIAVTFLAGCLFASLLPPLGNPLATATFSALLAVTVISAVATITTRNPVYCAIWFALALLGTGGLFLLNGAQFLGVATVAVYAGAIVVTFLFVLMLAQPEGHAFYDRISWGAVPVALAVAAGVFLVVLVVRGAGVLGDEQLTNGTQRTPIEDTNPVLASDHVAVLGSQLFTRHLISVQVAGVLLLAALVGAVAIAGRDGASAPERLVNSAGDLAAAKHRAGELLDE